MLVTRQSATTTEWGAATIRQVPSVRAAAIPSRVPSVRIAAVETDTRHPSSLRTRTKLWFYIAKGVAR